jgi:RecA-family ATPase
MAQNLEAPRWLVKDLWMAQSHGIIGGDPKSSKSLLSLALGLSIASGCPFLGDERFDVSTPGPVLMVQEENTPWDVQDKLRKLANLYGLIAPGDIERSRAPEGSVGKSTIRLSFPTEAPLLMLNNFGFDMGEEAYREALEQVIRDTGAVMVILDPLYLMLGDADPDRQRDVKYLQKWLLSLRYTYGCAVVVVHHFGKPRQEESRRGGHRLLGSGTWYNWVDSALYCEAREPDPDTTGGKQRVNRVLRIEREWRSAAPQAALDIQMAIGDPGDLRLRVEIDKFNLGGAIVRAVRENEGITLVQLCEMLSRDKRVVRKWCISLQEESKLRMEGGKRGRGHSWHLFSK